MAIRRCASCSKFLPAIKGRGRPALKCLGCRTKVIVLRSCRDCEIELPIPDGRGRPAVRCTDCRSKSKILVNA